MCICILIISSSFFLKFTAFKCSFVLCFCHFTAHSGNHWYHSIEMSFSLFSFSYMVLIIEDTPQYI